MATQRVMANRAFLKDLFAGPFRGHAILMDPEGPTVDWLAGDFAISERPLQEWLPLFADVYARRVRWHEGVGDDSVPYVQLGTGTELFAAAFGCATHRHDGSPPSARPLVTTAREADALAVPDLSHPVLSRVFEMGRLVQRELGTDVPIGVPDIQSPFDIAALIWNKEDMFAALYESPDAVHRLVAKCQQLLVTFLREFLRQFPNANLCHCPYAWAPPELGCWLSEDEAGSLSVPMFAEFCLPSLVDLSASFGGLFMHCCATADHQYGNFRRIPNLRGLNRVFQAPGPRPALEAFSGHTVFMVAWTQEQDMLRMLDLALPNTRFLCDMPAQPLDDARRTFERLRVRCPRR